MGLWVPQHQITVHVVHVSSAALKDNRFFWAFAQRATCHACQRILAHCYHTAYREISFSLRTKGISPVWQRFSKWGKMTIYRCIAMHLSCRHRWNPGQNFFKTKSWNCLVLQGKPNRAQAPQFPPSLHMNTALARGQNQNSYQNHTLLHSRAVWSLEWLVSTCPVRGSNPCAVDHPAMS